MTSPAQNFAPTEAPQTNLVPVGPPPTGFAPNGYGSFDPYARDPSSGGSSVGIGPPISISPPASPGGSSGASPPGFAPPSLGGLPSQPASSGVGPSFSAPPPGGGVNPGYGVPDYGMSSPPYSNPSVYGPPSGGFPQTMYPAPAPATLFPGGLFQGGLLHGGLLHGGSLQGGLGGTGLDNYSAYRLLKQPRFRHTYVGFGDSADDLNTNDTDVSLVFALPNFMYSYQPLYVVPSFSLHLWDGPLSTSGADLPGSAYSAFVDVGWNSDPNQIFGTELGVRVGAFTDFDTFNDDSIRVLGKGLVSFRLTPTSTLKAGAYYVDRLDYKLIPAGGLLWQPNPLTRFDLFFPQPKLARYFRTVGTKDVWWYVAGDFGGGSWTVERAAGFEDQVDLNELRAVAGLEWGHSDAIRAGQRTAFAEVGFAFERELVYRSGTEVDLDDGVMFRVGLGY